MKLGLWVMAYFVFIGNYAGMVFIFCLTVIFNIVRRMDAYKDDALGIDE